MDHHVTRRILHGLGANAYGQLVVIVIQLAGVPILLHAWGTQLYGEWLILAAIPTYLSMTDLGFSLSAANDMTARVARGDRAGALSVYQSLLALVCSFVAIALLVVTSLLYFLPLGNWLHLHDLSVTDVRWVLWLLAAEVLIKLIEGTNHAGFRANGDYAMSAFINYSTLLSQFIAVWFVAALGYAPVVAAAAFVAIRALVTPSVAVLLLRRHTWLHFGFRHARLSSLRHLLHPAIANLAMPLAMAVNIQGMLLVVGVVLGPIAVVVFSTLRTLTRLIVRMVTSVAQASEPDAAMAYGQENFMLLRTLYLQIVRASLWLTLVAMIILLFSGNWILEIWTDGKVPMDNVLFRWLLISAEISVLWYGGLTVLKAANFHLRATAVMVLAAVGAVALAWALLETTGQLSDVGIALVAMDTIMAGYVYSAAGRFCGLTPIGVLAGMANPLPLLQLMTRKSHAH